MTDAIRAEWTKLRTVAGTGWLLLGVVAATVGGSAAIAAATHVSPDGASGGGHDPTKLALAGIDLGQAVVAVLAVLAISEEYATGMVHVSLAAMPRRFVLLGAKAVNIAGLTMIASALAIAGCLITGRQLLPGAGLDQAHGYALVSIAHGPTLRAAAGSVLYLGLVALLSLGIATLIRDTAVSTGVVLGLLYLPPILAQLVTGSLHRRLEQLAPMTAGLAIQATRHVRTLPVSPWAGLGVLAAWTVGTLLIAGAAFAARDA
jgi:ABC-2 type transport system permease protein